jgi:hypothetical protein
LVVSILTFGAAAGRIRLLAMAEPLQNIIDAGWAQALDPVAGRIAAMGAFLRAEVAAGRRYLPAGENVLRAFKQPFDDVRVLIVGQDPYPGAVERGPDAMERTGGAAAEPGADRGAW